MKTEEAGKRALRIGPNGRPGPPVMLRGVRGAEACGSSDSGVVRRMMSGIEISNEPGCIGGLSA